MSFQRLSEALGEWLEGFRHGRPRTYKVNLEGDPSQDAMDAITLTYRVGERRVSQLRITAEVRDGRAVLVVRKFDGDASEVDEQEILE